ncbi:MAG: DNA methyltransferase Dim-2 [Cirrosporium novae-zelandiae]|nr:MAG: DNA methyltransferase Dim-2 [Cirrosporium novae-zelandiae]
MPPSITIISFIVLNYDMVCLDSESHEQDRSSREPSATITSFSLNRIGRGLVLSGIQLPGLMRPRSIYQGWKPRWLNACMEAHADADQKLKDNYSPNSSRHKHSCQLNQLVFAENATFGGDAFVSYDLVDFSIYRRELVFDSLHNLHTKRGCNRFFFDGVLTDGKDIVYVQRVPFEILNISYKVEEHSVGDVWVQSVCGESVRTNLDKSRDSPNGVYYRLKSPSPEYRRYHEAFLWLANFSKYLMEYLEYHEKEDISLAHFKANFHDWIVGSHGQDANFQKWLHSYPGSDFRQVVTAQADFLYNEAWNADEGSNTIDKNSVWIEALPDERDLRKIPMREEEHKKTVVTPYVKHCFDQMSWKEYLDSDLGKNAGHLLFTSPIENGLNRYLTSTERVRKLLKHKPIQVEVGDVIGIRQYDGPSNTLLQGGKYPWVNELFLSDQCNCDDSTKFLDIETRVNVNFFAEPEISGSEFFLRQKYISEDPHFMTLQQRYPTCKHLGSRSKPACNNRIIREGDTYVANFPGERLLQPVEIVKIISSKIRVRRFLRRRVAFNNEYAQPNELVHTEQCEIINADQVTDKCSIRLYSEADLKHKRIPSPANLPRPENVDLFLGSINDYHAQLMKDRSGSYKKGRIHCILAGSPCQGYSKANNQKDNARSQRNNSMIAAFCTAVNLHRPQYALMENVADLSHEQKRETTQPFRQLLCTLVGMGYQLRTFLADAWSHGSPQSRCRVFIWATAPGLMLPEAPFLTHSHPPRIQGRKLGVTPGNIPIGRRRFQEKYCFDFVSAEAAIKDLPDIGDGTVDCVPYPDHRTSAYRNRCPQEFISGRLRTDLKTTLNREFLEKEFPQTGAWRRVQPRDIFQTIMTKCRAADRRGVTCIHPWQHRLLTIQEARRAQSIPDDVVLVGYPAEQWKQVGNAVAGTVALALGLCLREAWLSNSQDEKERIGPPSRKSVGSRNEQLAKNTKLHERALKRRKMLDQGDSDSFSDSDYITTKESLRSPLPPNQIEPDFAMAIQWTKTTVVTTGIESGAPSNPDKDAFNGHSKSLSYYSGKKETPIILD